MAEFAEPCAKPQKDAERQSKIDAGRQPKTEGEMEPKSMKRPKVWSVDVEEAFRFQLAGYRDETQYRALSKIDLVDRWPHNGYIKKLVRQDGCFYYFNKERECADKDVNKCKIYTY